MAMKESVMPVAVNMNALLRPNHSIRKTDKIEQTAYLAPPHAAIRWDI